MCTRQSSSLNYCALLIVVLFHPIRFWVLLCQQAVSPVIPLTSKLSETRHPNLDLPAESEGFDWSAEESMEIVPSIFRPTKPESPIDINFDHSRAALGKLYSIGAIFMYHHHHYHCYSLLYRTCFFNAGGAKMYE